jgi:predicted Zn-dependent protease
MVDVALVATAAEGLQSQTRTWGRAAQMGGEIFDLSFLSEKGQQVATEALELLAAPNCPSGTMDLILMPDQMMLQIHESIGHPLELDRILGDERNYAGGSFVQLSDFRSLQYGSSLMNVTFDPTVRHALASYSFDDGGNPAQREYLIKDGMLMRGLGSVESQERSGIPGVANFRSSSWNRAPIDRMANVNIEPGQSKLEDMIASITEGIVMFTNRSWSIDDQRNKFQFGCEYGQLIKNGKLSEVVRNPNYRGETLGFWNRLSAVGQEASTYGLISCGKGEPNQLIRVGHSSPPCLFRDVEVFGGQS